MITAIVMVGAPDASYRAVRWVQEAQQAAARDLLDQLQRQERVSRILLVSPNAADLAGGGVEPVPSLTGRIHVGRELARLVERFQIERLLYLGGGAAPLLRDEQLSGVVEQLAASDRLVVANNRFSTDWAGVVPATRVREFAERIPRDNMLGWVLSTEGGLPFAATPVETATRLDIDTPADLLTLRLMPATKPHLRALLSGLPLDTCRLEQALDILRTPARRVFLAGRISPEAWTAVNRVSQCWLRVLAEERGMVASGREARGEVYSVLGDLMERVGIETFFARLPEWADLALLDTRVLFAHHHFAVPAADRFASDFGWAGDIVHPWAASLTAFASEAKIPVLLGGHTLLAGDLLALSDLLA